jgi:hypothetical protein
MIPYLGVERDALAIQRDKIAGLCKLKSSSKFLYGMDYFTKR